MSGLRATTRAAVAASIVSVLVFAPTTSASAHHQGALDEPSHKLVGKKCERLDEDSWKVTFTWRVTGGRYLNLGNYARRIRKNDPVRGGARVIRTHTYISGMQWHESTDPVLPPTEGIAEYAHTIAPIGHRNQRRNLSATYTVNLSCPA